MNAGHVVAVNKALLGRMKQRWYIISSTKDWRSVLGNLAVGVEVREISG